MLHATPRLLVELKVGVAANQREENMERASSFNAGRGESDGLYDAFALAALEARQVWTDALLSTALYGAKYSMAAATFMGASIEMLSALTHGSDGTIFDIGAVDPSDRSLEEDTSCIEDLADHLCESRMPVLNRYVLAYSVIR
ncbi:MAG: hypothetical protein J0H17_18330 [Rhizobiales bacterium]|nr:hypothetical protein [Hyphomicrobiales bacterium]